MVVSHENQHDETMLQALNLRTGPPLLLDTRTLPAGRAGTCRDIGRWCPAARSCWASTEPTSRSRWTTNARPTSWTCRRFASAVSPSPTVNGGNSSTMAATRSRGGGRPAAGSTGKAQA